MAKDEVHNLVCETWVYELNCRVWQVLPSAKKKKKKKISCSPNLLGQEFNLVLMELDAATC